MEPIKFKCEKAQSVDDGVEFSECEAEQGIWIKSDDAGEQCFVKLMPMDAAKLRDWLNLYLDECLRNGAEILQEE